MSKLLEWHTCPHCKKEKYCSSQVIRDHLEDCMARVKKHSKCPQCNSDLMPVLGGVLCSSHACDYSLKIVPGGKQ